MQSKSFRTKQPDLSLVQVKPQQIIAGEAPRATGPPPFLPKLATPTLFVVVLAVTAWGQPTPAQAQTGCETTAPKILVLRGVFEVFSLGMNDLGRKLRCCGYDVTVTSWSLALFEVRCDDHRPYVIIGHSLGGRMCAWTSRKLSSCGKRVPLIIIVDANVIQSIPSNVDRCVHLHVTNPYGIFHGHPVRGESPRTRVINCDISNGQLSWFDGNVNHFNIDATDWVHRMIIDEITRTFPQRSLTATSQELDKAPGDALTSLDRSPPPGPDMDATLPHTRRIPWCPCRPENRVAEERRQRPRTLAWAPDRSAAISPAAAGNVR